MKVTFWNSVILRSFASTLRMNTLFLMGHPGEQEITQAAQVVGVDPIDAGGEQLRPRVGRIRRAPKSKPPAFRVNSLDQLTQLRESIKERASNWEALQQKISEQDFINYLDRTRLFGEDNAMRWLANKYGDGRQPSGI